MPALCDVEVAAGLRRMTLRRMVSDRRADEALRDYVDLPLVRHGHLGLLGRILQLRSSFSAYDATYVALAERLGSELLTADGHLASAAKRHTEIHVLP